MPTISQKNTIAGTTGSLTYNGVPSAGTNAVFTLAIGGTPTAGATSGVRIKWQGARTPLILWSATDATFVANAQAQINATFGTNALVAADATLTNGIGNMTLTAGGDKAKLALPVPTVESFLTGTSPTAAITETTAGVTATHRGLSKGGEVTNTATGVHYTNTGTEIEPVWTVIGSQS